MDSDMEDIIDIMYILLLLYQALKYLRKIQGNHHHHHAQSVSFDRKITKLHENCFERLKRDPEQFRAAVRMNIDTFNMLCNLVRENLTKLSIRTPISAECRLFITLLYLARGGSRKLHTFTHKIGLTTFRRITLDTCEILWNELSPVYLPLPGRNEWEKIADDFKDQWNMPHCLGALDGKHISITCPGKSRSMYYSHKGRYSIVLLGVCDADYAFTAIDIGAYGSESDGNVFQFFNFAKLIEEKRLQIPGYKKLPKSNERFPHYFVGDSTFPLKTYLMRPYPGQQLLDGKSEYFNKRLSRARSVIENTFGIMTAKWRILKDTLCMTPQNAETVVKACVILHNFVKLTDSSYITADYVDQFERDTIIKGSWRSEVTPLPSVRRVSANRADRNSYDLRNTLREYFYDNKI